MNLDPVKKLQKRIIRLIAEQHYLAYTDPLFSRLKINGIHKFAIAQYMFHNVGYFGDCCNNPYPTRSANQIATLFQRVAESKIDKLYWSTNLELST